MKAANGDGSVLKRSDGRWVARWTEHDPDGTPRRRVAYATTKREATRKLREALARRDRGEVTTESRATFQAVADQWRSTAAIRQGLSRKSMETYTSVLRAHIYPVIGHLPIRQVTPGKVAEVLTIMDEKGMSAAYQRNAHKAISNVGKAAVSDGLLRANPAEGVKAPQPTRSPKVVPGREQIAAMVRAADEAEQPRTRALIVVLAHTGLRISEALSLEWSDWKGNTLQVHQGKGGKSRAVPVTRALEAELKSWKKAQAELRMVSVWWDTDHDWILSSEAGTQWDPRNARKLFRPIAAKTCPGATPHSLRHATATILLEQGVPMKVVSEVLGHSSMRLTADTYSHVTARLMSEAADALDSALGG